MNSQNQFKKKQYLKKNLSFYNVGISDFPLALFKTPCFLWLLVILAVTHSVIKIIVNCIGASHS